MPYDVVEQNGVIEVVPSERGKFEKIEDAAKDAQNLVAAGIKAEVEAQNKEDAEAEAASKPELPEPERTIEIIRANEPEDAVKLTEMAQVREIAKSMDIETRGKRELDLIIEIKAAL